MYRSLWGIKAKVADLLERGKMKGILGTLTGKLIDSLTEATVPSDRQPIGGVIFKNLTVGQNWISPSVIDVEIFNQRNVNFSILKLNANNYLVS